MSLRSNNKRYTNLNGSLYNDGASTSTPWYWRLIALIASSMILAGYLILPGLYAKEPQLKFSQAVLTVFVVALLTAGHSFTALLCFACRNEVFQAENVFLPALTSSGFGLLSIAYNFLSSTSYVWKTAAITGCVVSTMSTVLYGFLLLWTHRRIVKLQEPSLHKKTYSDDTRFYSNFLQNVYPSAHSHPHSRSPSHTSHSRQPSHNSHPETIPLSEDDRINQNMALLLSSKNRDSGPSPDAASATFRIDLPEDAEEQRRIAESSELVGTPPTAHQTQDWNNNRGRANSRPDSLSEEAAWLRWDRGRTTQRPSSTGARSNHSRGLSREERRREIELGQA